MAQGHNGYRGRDQFLVHHSSVLTTDAGSYNVIVTDDVGSVTSSSATLTVNPIATTIALSGLSVAFGNSTRLP